MTSADSSENTATAQTVVVTGAGSGIGRAIAATLAARGWRVVVTDVDEAAAVETCPAPGTKPPGST
jgi:meso-butanediol dehydrogenase / (S,S)-butanediol dehydrogenase / diacetyl reductase